MRVWVDLGKKRMSNESLFRKKLLQKGGNMSEVIKLTEELKQEVGAVAKAMTEVPEIAAQHAIQILKMHRQAVVFEVKAKELERQARDAFEQARAMMQQTTVFVSNVAKEMKVDTEKFMFDLDTVSFKVRPKQESK